MKTHVLAPGTCPLKHHEGCETGKTFRQSRAVTKNFGFTTLHILSQTASLGDNLFDWHTKAFIVNKQNTLVKTNAANAKIKKWSFASLYVLDIDCAESNRRPLKPALEMCGLCWLCFAGLMATRPGATCQLTP